MKTDNQFNSDTLTIHQYTGSFEDGVRLLEWYQEMLRDGTLDLTLFPSAQPLPGFMNMFQSGKNILFYFTDDLDKIWLAVWFEPILSSVTFLSTWVRSSHRKTKEFMLTMHQVFTLAFQHVSLILGVTKQEDLLKGHENIGYTISDKLPLLWEGVEDGWLVAITKEGFEKGFFPRIYNRFHSRSK